MLISIGLSFVTAFLLTYFAMPSVIHISNTKGLFDDPNERSSHNVRTPSLGGIAIFAGVLFSVVIWVPFKDFGDLQYILAAFLILFLVGVRDDLLPLSPRIKLMGQVLAAGILIYESGIVLNSFYGIFGMHETLPPYLSGPITMFVMLVIINAFNLIDGINGLAGSLGVLVIGTLGAWFFIAGENGYAIVAFSTVGALLAFLNFNFTPARIFMGDTGSLFLGAVSAILLIKFIDLNNNLAAGTYYKFEGGPVVAIGIAIVPLVDTLRVFVTRMLRGLSPFKPDRRHIHHLLIDYGFSHTKATALLFFVNLIFITFVFYMHDKVNQNILLFILLGLAMAFIYPLNRVVAKKRAEALESFKVAREVQKNMVSKPKMELREAVD